MSDRTMNEAEGFLGWILGGIAAIIATLTSAVAALYKSQIGDLKQQLSDSRESAKASAVEHRSEITRLDQIENELRKEIADCKTDREDLRVRLGRQEVELDLLKRRIEAVEQQ